MGSFHNNTPLKASRAMRNQLLGTVSSAQVRVSSQMENNRPPAETIALTLGV
jgi:hypothetical protein